MAVDTPAPHCPAALPVASAPVSADEVGTWTLPDASFFRDCAFVCVDIQPATKKVVTLDQLPKDWRDQGFTAEDVNAASAYECDVAYPNARKVADACRRLKLPMIFIHWGYQFRDGMDLDPATRSAFLRDIGPDYDKWPHHISRADSKPAEILGVRPGEYVLSKTAQDAFTSSNIEFVLRNLGIKNIVFIGGHTGACLGKTAASAKRQGFRTLCIADCTFDARQSMRLPNLWRTGYDYVANTKEFMAFAAARGQ